MPELPPQERPSRRAKMENFWAVLTLLVGAAVASPTLPTPLSYEQVVASAVATYNQESGLENTFRLLEAEPQPEWDPSAQSVQPLKFSIQETVCRVEDSSDLDQCEVKVDGLDRDCSGFYSTAQSPPLIVVQCEDTDQEMERITRGRLKRWRKKWKKKLRKVLKQQGANIALGTLSGSLG